MVTRRTYERKYIIDQPKLWEAFNKKRLRNGHSWKVVSFRLGVSASALMSLNPNNKKNKPSMDASTFIAMVVYVNKPMTQFIIENEEVGNGYQDPASV